MDLVRHLRYFLVVAEELHVGHAADRIGMTQPALSQRIRRLEQELGARLFDRTSQGVLLTAAGEVVRAEAEDLLDRFDRLRVQVSRAARGEIGVLRVGVPPQLAGRSLAAVLEEMSRARPDVHLDLQEVPTPEQLRMLSQGALDAALVHQPFDAAGLVVGPSASIPLGVVLPRGATLADLTEVALADLAGEGVVLPPREAAPGYYDATLAACRARGFDPVRVRHAANPELVLALVLAGEGVAFDSGAVAQKEARVVWRPLADGGLVWRLALAWPAERNHPAIPALADIAVRALSAAPGYAPGRAGDAATVRAGALRAKGSGGAAASRQGPWTVVNPGLHAGARPPGAPPGR